MTHAPKTHSRTTPSRTSRSLRSAARLGLGLLSLLSLSAGTVAYAGTVNWDGTAADWFSNPSHWVGGTYPGAGDDAVNMSTAAMTLGQSTTINSFFSNGAFTLQGGTFTGNQANSASNLTVNNVFTDDGGTINNFTVNQGTGGSVVFTGSGGNSISNSILNANLDLATNSNAYLDLYGAVTENGAITLGTTSNGIRLVDSSTVLTLGTKGSLTGFGNLYQYNANTVTNNGLINANSSTNALNLTLTQLNNNGTAEATKGATLNFNSNNVANNGTISADGMGSIAALTGVITNGASSLFTVTNGGQVQVNGASLLGTINTDAKTALVFNGSGSNNINGEPSAAVINGNLDLATNANAYLDLYGGVTENGNINLGTTSNGIRLVDSSTVLTLGSKGSLTGFGTLYQYNANTVTNNGLVNANSKGNMLNLAVTQFNSTGTTEATSGGTLALNNTNTTAATGSTIAATGAGSVVALVGVFTGAGNNLITTSGGGQFQVNGASLLGTINTDAKTALVFNSSGSNNINGEPSAAVINGNLDLATNANAYLDLYGGVTENGNINLGTTSNGIRLVDSSTNLIVGSTGSVNGFGSVYQYNANTLTNNGLVNANVSGQTLNINTTAFANTGTVQVLNGAALSVTSANTDSGNILVKKGGTATFTQGVTQTAGLTQADGTLNSAVTLTGGTLAGSGTVNGDVANSGGTVAAGSPFGTLAVNGAFSQASGGTLDAVFSSTQNNLLKVSGAVTTGGFLSVNYLGAGPFTAGNAPFTFLDYGTLTSSITGAGPTQFFSNETFDSSGNGLIAGSNGFLYELLNNTSIDGLQLEVLNNGAPTPAVPEASTTISFGLLLALGGLVIIVKRRRTASVS